MIKSTKIIYCQLNFINDVTFKHYLHKIKLAYKGKVMKKKILMTVFDLILFVVLVVSIFLSYNYVNFQLKKKQIEDSMSEELAVLHENINENEPKYTLDYYKNYYHNDDIVGRLKIYNTGIDTLIVQSTNNEYYLNHTLEKKYDDRGSIFVDYRTNLSSKQINIYGHNSNVYNLMFRELENYLDDQYYEKHKYIELWDGIGTRIYEIFSIQIVTSNYEHMNINASNWSKHISKLNNSIYDTQKIATAEDEILVIQTCLYNPVNSLLLIIAKEV